MERILRDWRRQRQRIDQKAGNDSACATGQASGVVNLDLEWLPETVQLVAAEDTEGAKSAVSSQVYLHRCFHR